MSAREQKADKPAKPAAAPRARRTSKGLRRSSARTAARGSANKQRRTGPGQRRMPLLCTPLMPQVQAHVLLQLHRANVRAMEQLRKAKHDA